MLQLSSTLQNQPVVSLRLGGTIATAVAPIINPHNLKILGWWCKEPSGNGHKVLLSDDVREINAQGIAINNEDELADPEDLVRHQDILEIDFELIGMPVKTAHTKVGKVNDYSYNEGMFVQKLYVSPGVSKILGSDHTRVIDRTQIVEITSKHIVVKDTEVSEGAEAPAAVPA